MIREGKGIGVLFRSQCVHTYTRLLTGRCAAQSGFVDEPKLQDAVAQVCVRVHSSVERAAERFWVEMRRRFYTTPTAYLELLSLFFRLYDETRTRLQNNIMRSARRRAASYPPPTCVLSQ